MALHYFRLLPLVAVGEKGERWLQEGQFRVDLYRVPEKHRFAAQECFGKFWFSLGEARPHGVGAGSVRGWPHGRDDAVV